MAEETKQITVSIIGPGSRGLDTYGNYLLNCPDMKIVAVLGNRKRRVDYALQKLNLPDTSVLENEDGKITIDSLIAFCDSFLSANLVSDDVKAEIRRIIGDAKTAAELANKATTTMYASDLAALESQIGTVISTINSAYDTAKLAMNATQKAEIEAVLADLALVETKVGEIMDGGITLTEVELLSADMEAKAKAMLSKIEQDLSEAELAAANARIESLIMLKRKHQAVLPLYSLSIRPTLNISCLICREKCAILRKRKMRRGFLYEKASSVDHCGIGHTDRFGLCIGRTICKTCRTTRNRAFPPRNNRAPRN